LPGRPARVRPGGADPPLPRSPANAPADEQPEEDRGVARLRARGPRPGPVEHPAQPHEPQVFARQARQAGAHPPRGGGRRTGPGPGQGMSDELPISPGPGEEGGDDGNRTPAEGVRGPRMEATLLEARGTADPRAADDGRLVQETLAGNQTSFQLLVERY